MATTLIGWRPSALTPACPSNLSDRSVSILPALVVGRPVAAAVVAVEVGHAQPVFDNSIGATAALAAAGATASKRIEMAAAKRDQRDDLGTVSTGGYARGIPPRGRRQV